MDKLHFFEQSIHTLIYYTQIQYADSLQYPLPF